jgi:hypothetical protein
MKIRTHRGHPRCWNCSQFEHWTKTCYWKTIGFNMTQDKKNRAAQRNPPEIFSNFDFDKKWRIAGPNGDEDAQITGKGDSYDGEVYKNHAQHFNHLVSPEEIALTAHFFMLLGFFWQLLVEYHRQQGLFPIRLLPIIDIWGRQVFGSFGLPIRPANRWYCGTYNINHSTIKMKNFWPFPWHKYYSYFRYRLGR